MTATRGNALAALGLVGLVRQWHAAGAGARAIAARLRAERNVDVSHMTVARTLATAGEPPRAIVAPPAGESPVDRAERRSEARALRPTRERRKRTPAPAVEVLDPEVATPLDSSPAADAQAMAELIAWCRRIVRMGEERLKVPRWRARQMFNILERLPDTGKCDGDVEARGVPKWTLADALSEHVYVHGGLRPEDGPDDELVEIVQHVGLESRLKVARTFADIIKAKYGPKLQVLTVNVNAAAPNPAVTEQLAKLSPAARWYLQRGELPPPGVVDVPLEEIEREIARGGSR